ncbi:MAG: hypothetical protein JWM64_585, partial [Frankiales bacterium]|nr:hypothetical protein [Frankiales bacterium]
AGAEPEDVRRAAAALAPGGRLVATAAHGPALVAELGLVLRHVEAVGDVVAWSAVAPLRP